jgi:integrase
MASAWVVTRTTTSGTRRHEVRYRLGGRESASRYGGSFRTKAEALARQRYIAVKLAALELPDLDALKSAPAQRRTLLQAAEAWRTSRVDVSPGTMQTYRVSIARLRKHLGDVALDDVDPARMAQLVADLNAAGLRKQTVRKTLSVAAMVFDHERVSPNPARDRQTVRLPREERRHLQPPTAAHVLAVHRLLPSRYRLPLLVLDAVGMRVGELEALTWGDVDEPRGRWRVAANVAKTGRPRWVEPPALILAAVTALVPREDRVPERHVFDGFGADRFRTALMRACSAAAVPTFSPHDLRHRRVSLLHLAGMPWARIGEVVGHDDLVTTARTYTHVIADEGEVDYASLLARS